jgi:hypothetical protein
MVRQFDGAMNAPAQNARRLPHAAQRQTSRPAIVMPRSTINQPSVEFSRLL